MQPSDFSETQFVVGFLREYLNSFTKRYWLARFILMPSTVTERRTGADFIINNTRPKGSDFFQFKRSDYLSNRRGLPLNQRLIDASFFPCYRFKVYNTNRTKQFDVLRNLARRSYNHCAYIAPAFHTFDEFNTYFAYENIMANSVEIECSQFNSSTFAHIVPGTNHNILFNLNASDCWVCSDPVKISFNRALFLKEKIYNIQYDLGWTMYLNELIMQLVDSGYELNEAILKYTPFQKMIYIAHTLQREANIFWIPRFE